MEGEDGHGALFQPKKVTVGQKLKTVGVLRIFQKPAAKLVNVEACLDLFNRGIVAPEDAVHAAFDAEAIAAAIELPGNGHLGFVGRVRLCPLPLDPRMDLLALGSCTGEPGMCLDAAFAGGGKGEITEGDRYHFVISIHSRQL